MKNLFLKIFVIIGIFLMLAPDARADWFSLANPLGITSSVLDYLGFDIAEIRNSAKYFNVARKKKDVPSVDLTFSPTNPAIGEKITATAAVMNFVGEAKQVYFTWYMRHDNNDGITSRFDYTLGENGRNIDCDGDGNCDWNDDDDIDIEDYKIEAMRIIANGGFDWEKAKREGLYSSASYNDHGPLSGKYESIFGGESQRGKYDDIDAHCFFHDFDSGDTYEFDECIHLFPNAPDDTTAPDVTEDATIEFTLDEKEFWHTNPLMPDTAGTGFSDEANVAGLGATKLTWNYQPGDEVGVAVEGAATETTIEADTTYKVMWALPKNKCDATGLLTEYTEGLQDPVASTTTTTTDPITGNITTVVTESYEYAILDNINFTATVTTTLVITTTVTDSEGTVISGPTVTDSSGVAVVKPITYNNAQGENENTGIAYDATDRALPYTTEVIDTLSIDPEDMNDCLVENLVNPGEGSNTKALEVSLAYSPEIPMNDSTDTNADILTVTASVIGSKNNNLKYTWEVYASDEINPPSWGAPLRKDQLPEAKQTSGIGLSSFNFKLALTPELLDGLPIPKYLRVKVIVSEQGLVSSTVEDDASLIGEGNADIIIPITSITDQIHVYPVEADENLVLSLSENAERCNSEKDKIVCPVVKNEIVGVNVPDSTGAFSNIFWTIDGAPIKPLSYKNNQECLSGECDPLKGGEPTNIAYFPVLKETGERYSLGFTATKEGKKISLLKTFEVADPEVSIVSADEITCRPELLGHYIDLDGTRWPDYSEDSYQAVTGSNISLKPVFNMSFVDNKQWYIDGVAIDANTAPFFGATVSENDILTFPVNKLAGEIYSVAYSAFYKQDNNIKKILNESFDVQLNEFYEKQLGDAIEVLAVDAFNVAEAQKMTPKKFLASLASNTPAYLNFLFRIVLTVSLFLFVSRIIFALFPKTN